jgi:holo-[acyl-carrier protein] synthase
MIVGVGLDIVDIPGFEAQLGDSASTFGQGTFTEGERRAAAQRPSGNPAVHLAARFAAKEAFIKAWSGANRGKAPALAKADLREIEVINDPHGRPALKVRGKVAEAISTMGDMVAHLSLSHDGNVAAAVVVLEKSHQATESWT